ncbi:hypothetical protein ACLKOZ_15905 [Arthrobacter sp. R4]|uniref:hypothetical protein n=1 Tax=Arthrobacter sp. R4 TaxID=644417 RepID=UPI003ED8B3FD
MSITIDPTTGGPVAAPRQAAQKRLEMSPGVGCLLALIALAVIIALITWVSSSFSPQNNPQKTEENGLATCKELISKQKNGGGNQTVQGSVLAGDLYKATIADAGFSKVYRWTCRLEWSGGQWTTDILESHQIQ